MQGVSTRKVSAITEGLCGTSFSKSTVSALCAGLDPRVRSFNERRLDADYPFVMVDALFIKAREDDRVVMRATLIASGIHSDGMREILGIRIGDSESYTSCEEMFRWLRGHGLRGVMFLISDSHGGLMQAATKALSGRALATLPGAFDAQSARSQHHKTARGSRCQPQTDLPGSGHNRGQTAPRRIRGTLQ